MRQAEMRDALDTTCSIRLGIKIELLFVMQILPGSNITSTKFKYWRS